MDDTPSVLVAILDVHPLSWTEEAQAGSTPDDLKSSFLSITNALNQLLVFFNTHLAMRWGNELVLYVAMANGKSELLYSSQAPSASLQHPVDPNMFEPFHATSETIRSRLRQLMAKQIRNGQDQEAETQEDGLRVKGAPAIVPALLRALCHINRIHPAESQSGIQNIQSSATGHYVTDESESIARARIMIINNSHENGSGGYVGLMNAVFAAQKRKTPIDVVNLHAEDSIFLQQASHLTHGIYYRFPEREGLLQYLNLIFIASPEIRKQLGLPSQHKVDFRAVCFCHHRVVDVGFVCSVCLSIFCEPIPICHTCKSRFPVQSITYHKNGLRFALPSAPSASSVPA